MFFCFLFANLKSLLTSTALGGLFGALMPSSLFASNFGANVAGQYISGASVSNINWYSALGSGIGGKLTNGYQKFTNKMAQPGNPVSQVPQVLAPVKTGALTTIGSQVGGQFGNNTP